VPGAGSSGGNAVVMQLTADPGLALVAISAEAGSPADDALRFLTSWAATQEPADAGPDVILQSAGPRCP
jgi:hypothetical protein